MLKTLLALLLLPLAAIAQTNTYNVLDYSSAASVGKPSASTGALTLYNSSNAYKTQLQSSAPSSDLTWTLPGADGVGCLKSNGSGALSFAACGSGTVTSLSVSAANGFGGTVATSTITPALTLTTSVTGILKGNGSGIVAAVAGDFPTLNQSTTGAAGSVIGTTTNDNAAAGVVGEYVTSSVVSGSAITLSTGTTANVTSISLTAGDWDVSGVVDHLLTSVTGTLFSSGISTVSATIGGQDTFVQVPLLTTTLSAIYSQAVPTVRLSLASTTTVYLLAQTTFSFGTGKAYGTISARRRR